MPPASASPDPARVRALIASTLRDLQPGRREWPTVRDESRLDRDLGLDSLARMELFTRAGQVFGVEIAEDALRDIETVGDLQRALLDAPSAAKDSPGRTASRPDIGDAFGADAAAGGLADATHLLAVLDWHCRVHPDRVQHVILHDDTEIRVTYRQLDAGAEAVACGLQRAGITNGQSVAIMLPTSREYFEVYLGILKSGAIPVPIYPPARASQLEDHVRRHAAILANAQAVALVTIDEARRVAWLLQASLSGARLVATPAELGAQGGTAAAVPVRGDDIAFIQYTSGSTGVPKGVVLTHANLLANIRAMAQVIEATPDDVFVSWLPLYHDMGLIGAWLGSLYVGFPLVVMSPLSFLARPMRWLEAIQRWRGTLSAAPNFAYELCLKRIGDAEIASLDLSSWRLAFNGAEAVGPDTMERFVERFAASGLRPQTMAPVYGLAEAAVGLLFPPLGRPVLIDSIKRDAFEHAGRALPAEAGESRPLRFVACGRPLPGYAIRVVDAEGHTLGERSIGRLEFRGPSATPGYFRAPELTQRLIHDGWHDTGDRAYVAGGDVFLTGRVKDMVIRGGRNLYPQEIEEAVGAVEGVRKGCVAVFGSPDRASGTEKLVVLAETAVQEPEARVRLQDAITRAVVVSIGEPPDEIVLAPAHAVLKTSSGKVRRSACRELYESGRALDKPRSASAQVLRLAVSALLERVRGATLRGVRALGTLRILASFALCTPPAWLAVWMARSPAQAWRNAGRMARVWLRLAGLRPGISGLGQLPQGPFVAVCNHASYLDGFLLVAALPRPLSFVAKRELADQRIAGTLLKRLGTLFVERFDARQGVADAEAMAIAVARGGALLVFPEGTFNATPGLLPFHLGAFLAAARAAVPLVPLAIVGSRAVLPDGTWWPRPGTLRVEVLPAIPPGDAGRDAFARAVESRDAARDAIAARTF